MIRLGILLEDAVYRERFAAYLMNHYQDRIRPELFPAEESRRQGNGKSSCAIESRGYEERRRSVDAVITDMADAFWNAENGKSRIFRLYPNGTDHTKEEGEYGMDKYQDVNRIVEEILQQIGKEVHVIYSGKEAAARTRLYGVYGLGSNEYQLPFAVTLTSLLQEKQKVLLLDLQENSGLQQLADRSEPVGLEELLVMVESGRYSHSRMQSCIGRMEQFDYVYPAKNTENLCEVKEGTVLSLLEYLMGEKEYDAIVINFGARFSGFFDIMKLCEKVFLLQGQILRGSWREIEFLEELRRRGAEEVEKNLLYTEIPVSGITSCGRLIEQWKWNEFGDWIKRSAAAG